MTEDVQFDVIVAGGGMTGGLFAAALATQCNLRICVLEGARPPEFPIGSSPDYDIRVSALSVASERMFRNVGAWDGIVKRRACPYRRMRVWEGERGGTLFDAADVDADQLGHIVENRVIQLALLERLEAMPAITVQCPTRLTDYRRRGGGNRNGGTRSGEPSHGNSHEVIVVTLDDGRELSCRLLVGADGATSTVRTLAGVDTDRSAYDQHALVATIATLLPQQNITWQRFVPSGPQAFLPLVGSYASMVWYHEPEEVARLKALQEDDFAREMEAAFPVELGGVSSVLARASFPIAKAHAQAYIGERVALVGDAAHTVHPLAGQGVNIGMLDAACLAEVVSKASSQGRDIGRARTLRRYERWRYAENALMIATLDGFHHAFGTSAEPLRSLRKRVLDLADRTGPIKRHVMQRAMGVIGDLPVLAKG